MQNLSEKTESLKPSVAAAVGLLARKVLPGETTLPSVAQILALTGSSKGQAYEMLPRLEDACRGLHRRPGRSAEHPRPNAVEQTMARVRDFVIEHPGAVSGRGTRRNYSVQFRRFVIDLLTPDGPAHSLTVEQTAAAVGVPLGTLKDWLRTPAPELGLPQTDRDPAPEPEPPKTDCDPAPEPEPPKTDCDPPPPPAIDDVTDLAGNHDIGTILVEWTTWTGDFISFCDHLRENLRLPNGRTFVSRLLEGAGLRQPVRRKQPRPTWNKDSFRKLFPGAQWLGDGTTLAIQVNARWYAFNLEAILDAASGAVIGIHVSDTENEKAVLAAFKHGVHSTGHPSVVMTLDNKPCNHTAGVEQGINPTILVPATPGRGQAKAPLEGDFGLLAQTAPPLKVSGKTGRELARSILSLVVLIRFWTRNGKPRTRFGGLTPSQYYRDTDPTPEQIEEAKKWAAELRRRQERFRETKRRRADPVRRQILTEALERNGIDDPRGRLAVDLARYAIDAILHGIAIFEAKRDKGTIPKDADPGRYLAGIIRNRHNTDEIEQTGQRLLQLRLRHRDLCLATLEAQRDWLRQTVPAQQQPANFIDQALDADRLIDFRFYAHEATSTLAKLPTATARSLYPHLLRRISAAFKADPQRRQNLLGLLAQAVADRAA